MPVESTSHYDWELRLYWTYRAVVCKMNEKIILYENQTFIGMAETEEVFKWHATE